MNNTNNILQWLGTAALMVMYVIMSFFPEQRPWNLVAGLVGGSCFLLWTIRVKNTPQMIINLIGVLVCAAGIYTALNTDPEVPRQSGIDKQIECERLLGIDNE